MNKSALPTPYTMTSLDIAEASGIPHSVIRQNIFRFMNGMNFKDFWDMFDMDLDNTDLFMVSPSGLEFLKDKMDGSLDRLSTDRDGQLVRLPVVPPLNVPQVPRACYLNNTSPVPCFSVQTFTDNDTQVNAVNARELHEFLEVGKDYSTWIKDRIEKYDFKENQDFIINPNSGDNSSKRGPKFLDYIISLDMAKELSMVERNSQGKAARQWFIQKEKELRGIRGYQVSLPELPKTYAEALRLAADQAQIIEDNEKIISIQKPKAETYDKFMSTDGLFSSTDVAKPLGLSAIALNRILIDRKILFRDIKGTIRAYKPYHDKGYFVTKNYVAEKGQHAGTRDVFTLEGAEWVKTFP